MLNRIVQFSLRFRGVVIALACVVIGYGWFVAARAKLDVFPEFAPPMVVIQTEAPGLSPEQVEQLVTRPVENGINGVPNLESIRSQSIQGLSVVTVVFGEDADIYRARQTVSERLTQIAGDLPQGVAAPKMGALTSSTSLMLAIGLTSTNRTAMELRTFADWTLRPRLLGVPGVAKVDVFGGEVRQLQIQYKPDRLVAFGLDVEDVLAAARKSTGIRGAGFVEDANARTLVRSEGQSITPQQLGEMVLAHHDGVSVRLKDVADVVEAPEPKLGDALIMGERGVILLPSSQYTANTMDVTLAVERALDEMKPLFASEKITVHPRLFRPANFIQASLHNINSSLFIGGVLVVVVLFLFLLDLRTAFISFTSSPLSLLAAVIVLDRFGVTLNTLTLGGFAIAIGVVVDDAIQTAYQGTVAAQTYEGNRVFDVSVILDPASRKSTATLGALMLRNAEGLRVPLRELAEIYSGNSRYVVTHDGARRRQQVTCNIAAGDSAAFSKEVKKQVESKVSLPSGVYLVYGGSTEAQAKARRDLLIHSLIAAVAIVLLLAIEFRTVRNLSLILANLPFALVGGVLAVFASGGLLSIGSLVGFVTLFGITMRNSIMMISHFEHLVRHEGMTWGLEAAIRGASERLLPILMTALVTALGLLPLALGTGEAGREIEGPMAIVILGGLLTSTVLNLLVLPTLALRYGRFQPAQEF